MPDDEQAKFNFWWPSHEAGGTVMFFSLIAVVGIAWYRAAQPYSADGIDIALEVVFSLVGWYFVINLTRAPIYAWKKGARARQEGAELRSLRRQVEIRKMKDQLADSVTETNQGEQQKGGG